jgi:ParB-like nuclease family protein
MKMNMYPSFTDLRNHLYHKFFKLRTNARRELLWAKLMGKNTNLASFPEEAPEKSPNRKYMGTGDIPVERIVGTISRHGDFDYKFRPLNKHLLERWVNVHLTLEREGWSPILVHKVGENYYVEDGHHRVSIAQALGMSFIQARVWDYPSKMKITNKCSSEPCPEISSAQVYARVTD